MTPVTILAQMRRVAKVNTDQYSDANALIDLNTLKDEFWSAIINSIDENYNYETWTTTSVDLQGEYGIPAVAYNTAGAKILTGVSISYDGDTYNDTSAIKYYKWELVDPKSLDQEWNYYVENQEPTQPIYFVSDNSVFIAPCPRVGEGAASRIKMSGIRKIPDYTFSSVESDIRLPIDQHQTLVYWMIMFGLMNKGVDDGTINNAEARWLRNKSEAIESLKQRVSWPVFMTYPTNETEDQYIVTL